jgi:uncharacterized alpha-E superfamily protein
VSPLATSFQSLRDQLVRQADDAGAPLVVVLTPGPFNETYFEHAYLASQLGLPLVQGQDLTVRADTVFLKTLAGLQRVHGILRRLDDDYCDPLELRADSALGVPGMLGAVRAGRVAVANALGSGVLESAAWLGFLPGAAQFLLGESLSLPAVATWWCGEQPALEYVADNLDRLVVKATFPNQKFDQRFGRDLGSVERAQLMARLRDRPYAYVAQERISLSQAPSWLAGATLRLTPRTLTMRVYAIASAEGYQVMPGGLARIAAEGMVDIVSSQRGGGSKDVWVLGGEDAVRPGSPPGSASGELGAAPHLPRHDELPAQLVENLYWFGRYAERCEDKARLLRATLAMRMSATVWRSARAECVRFGVLPPDGDVSASLHDEALEFGVAEDLRRLGWCASQARSRLSAEHWRAVSVMQRQFHEAGATAADPVETLERLLVSLTALSGFALDDMMQDDGWRLLMLGRRLERMQFLAGLLAARLGANALLRQAELDWLLEVGGASIAYRTRYVAIPQLQPVLQLLIFDAASPRALAFQWHAVRRTLADLADSLGAAADDQLEEPIAQLSTVPLDGIDDEGDEASARRQALGAALAMLRAASAHLCDRLALRHFSLVDLDLQTVAT